MTYVYDFAAAPVDRIDLLGGKGAGLAAMTRLGLPVPPGFVITTEACRHFLATGEFPDGMWDEVTAGMARLEAAGGRSFGGGTPPLLVSVRSGAPVSMPGMMDTVLNLGMNDAVTGVLAEWASDDLAWDVRRRFLQMFGTVVRHLPDQVLRYQPAEPARETALRLERLIEDETGRPVTADPYRQLAEAIEGVFASWDNRRAREYRRLHGIPADLGTAVSVQMMVFGDMGDGSGTGVAFTRDPATGERVPYGDYLPDAQGEEVVSGHRDTLGLDELARLLPDCHHRLLGLMETLEAHYRDMCDIEFTIERGALWLLQTRIGKRTAAAAVRMAAAMETEGLIDPTTAVTRIDPATLHQLYSPHLPAGTAAPPLTTGVAASPGAAVGTVVFDPDRAVAEAAAGRDVILVRNATTPEDVHGMAAARGILTRHGGKTSHAAVVARGMGRPAVTGATTIEIDERAGTLRIGTAVFADGDLLTIDGTTGRVFAGALDLAEPVAPPELDRILAWADEHRRLAVRVNADRPDDARRGRELGAAGIGLARTEHMFSGDRLSIVRRIILTDDDRDRADALEELEAAQVGDFEALLEAMDGLPVAVRLLDPPLHEFLPDRLEVERDLGAARATGAGTEELEALGAAVARWEEANPMLGLRGVRLTVIIPGIYRIQVQAALEAVRRRLDAGGDPRLEILVPLVSAAAELHRVREMIEEEIHDAGRTLEIKVGTMIEVPRAALTAGLIAAASDFFSFGTNDLTQTTFALSRDDAEGAFLGRYVELGILASDPFQTLDLEGVGELIRVAVERGRAANPGLGLGICGEHAADPASIAFCHHLGLDYVSCSPPRIPAARLAAAQAAIAAAGTGPAPD